MIANFLTGCLLGFWVAIVGLVSTAGGVSHYFVGGDFEAFVQELEEEEARYMNFRLGYLVVCVIGGGVMLAAACN
jgi:hypothetical protein